MSNITGKGLVAFAKNKVGTPYVYGAKGGILTKSQVNTWSRMYPNVYSSSYVRKALSYVGKPCTDCSGLISWYTGVVKGSSGLYAEAYKKESISTVKNAPLGAILWRSGHVAVYIGDGKCVEAKGINYGTKISNISDCRFTHWLLMKYIDYDQCQTTPDNSKDNWIRDLQAALNRRDRSVRLVEDGIAGKKTLAACPTIKKGTKGIVTSVLQDRLKDLKYYKVEPTGTYGSGSVNCMKSYQKDHDLTPDGIVGQKTWKSLLGL